MVYTFWEGEMPDYIKLCMNTWHFPVTILNYDNLNNYTDLQITSQLKRFTLPQIADCVRVHVLRDQGGYWLDADTIMISDKLPNATIMGDSITRMNTIGFLHTDKPRSDMFIKWARYQDYVINNPNPAYHWSIMGNAFTDQYLKERQDISVYPVYNCWPETYMINGNAQRYNKYREFYFGYNYNLDDLLLTNMLMLHNSWTPDWYKELTRNELLNTECTMTNILKEVL